MNSPCIRCIIIACFAVLSTLCASSARALGSDDDVIIVGGDRSYPPYEFLDADGRPAGYNVDLTRAIARVMGLRVEIRLGQWDVMRHALENGEIDVLEGMSFSAERAKVVDFTPAHTIVHHSIFGRRGSPSAISFVDLAGKDVLVLREGIMHDLLRRQYPRVHPIPVDTFADALAQLAAGKYDYALLAKLPGIYLIRELKLSNLAPMGDPVAVDRYGWAIARGRHPNLANRFGEGLAILKNTGEYQTIYEKWLGVLESGGMSWREVARYGTFIVMPLVLLLGWMALWSRILRQRVATRTAELTREVAERKQTEQELRRNQAQLVQAGKMAALGVLVSGVAHEINNPNGLILFDLPVLKDAFGDAEPILEEHFQKNGDFLLGGIHYSKMRESIPRMLGEMLDASHRVKRIVDDLKDFARQETPDLQDGVAINQVVQTSVRLVANLIHKSTSCLQLECASDLPPIRANPQRIEQVVINLLVNACQALPSHDRKIRIVTFFDDERQSVGLQVHDEGVGIPPEHLGRLTEPFFTTKRESGGSGLGLAVSAGIVKEHGGTLAFQSLSGQGTIAQLYLPISPKEHRA